MKRVNSVVCAVHEDYFSEKIEVKVYDVSAKITLLQWGNEGSPAEKGVFYRSVKEATDLLKSKVQYFLLYLYIK